MLLRVVKGVAEESACYSAAVSMVSYYYYRTRWRCYCCCCCNQFGYRHLALLVVVWLLVKSRAANVQQVQMRLLVVLVH